jgi:hypothetical protein
LNIQLYAYDSSRRYPYSDAVVGLEWPDDLESCVSGSVVNGRAYHAREVKGDDTDKKRCPGPPNCSLGVRLTTNPLKICSVEQLLKK